MLILQHAYSQGVFQILASKTDTVLVALLFLDIFLVS